MEKYCPFCDGEGEIYSAKVKEDDQQIYICGECDTMWLTTDIREDNAMPFDCFMLNKGLKPLWSQLKDVKKVE